jgi:hypothetical protein
MPVPEPDWVAKEVLQVEGARALNPFQLIGQILRAKKTLGIGRMQGPYRGLYAAASITENF